MDDLAPIQTITPTGDLMPPDAGETEVNAALPTPTQASAAALAAAQTLAKKATAAATLRAYKDDWTHFYDWCAVHGFVAVPAAPAIVGTYLASLADSHAPATIRRRLSALGKMHRFNDLAWNSAHRDIQGPLQGALRSYARPPQKAAALTLPMLRQLLATCDESARGRRDRALLLFGFVGALRPARASPGIFRSRPSSRRQIRIRKSRPPGQNGGAAGRQRPSRPKWCRIRRTGGSIT